MIGERRKRQTGKDRKRERERERERNNIHFCELDYEIYCLSATDRDIFQMEKFLRKMVYLRYNHV